MDEEAKSRVRCAERMTDQVLGPKVSVIMAAFNASSFVDEALESIAAQTYENWELIVCDDASTDETYEMLKAFESPRV